MKREKAKFVIFTLIILSIIFPSILIYFLFYSPFSYSHPSILGLNDKRTEYVYEEWATPERELLSDLKINDEKYYQSFSSAYYDLIKDGKNIYVTSDSVLNYTYVQIERAREILIKEKIDKIFTTWIDDFKQYLNKINTNNNEISIDSQNLIKTINESLTYPDYESKFITFTSEIESMTIGQKILLTEYVKRNRAIEKVFIFNDLFGISDNTWGVYELSNNINSKTSVFDTFDEIHKSDVLGISFKNDDADLSLSFFDNVFADIEGYWATKYENRANVVGEIRTMNIYDDRISSINNIENKILIESDKEMYLLLEKYINRMISTLNNYNISTNSSSELLTLSKSTISMISSNTIVNKDILKFITDCGSVANSDDISSVLITFGTISSNGYEYVGPVYIVKDIPKENLNGKVLGASIVGNFNSGYDYKVKPQAKGTVRIPVLMYHNIAPMPSKASAYVRGLYVTPSMFDQQMAYLKKKKYKTLTTQEFYDQLKSGVNPENKSILLTFDDGSRGQYTNAYPILKKYKLTGIFYIISGKSPINMTEVKKMSKNGMIIDSHTTMHEDLKRVKATKQLKYEIVRAKKDLEKITGQEIVSIAYPGCVADSRTFKIAKENGYKLGFSCGSGIDHTYKNRMYLSRVHVFSDMYRFKKALSWGL